MAEGAWGSLRSVTPNLTPPGWTTAFTGVNPGKHGIFDFFALDPGAEAPRVVSSADRKAPALWEILGYFGTPAGVFNVPSTYPADRYPDCFMHGHGHAGVHGAVGRARRSARRARAQEFPGVPSSAPTTTSWSRGTTTGYLDAALAQLTGRAGAGGPATWSNEYGAEVLFFVYDDLDRVMHFYWHFMDAGHPRPRGGAGSDIAGRASCDYYQRVEEGHRAAPGGGWAKAPTSASCRDHGFGPLHTDVFLNRRPGGLGLPDTPLPGPRTGPQAAVEARAKKVVPGPPGLGCAAREGLARWETPSGSWTGEIPGPSTPASRAAPSTST